MPLATAFLQLQDLLPQHADLRVDLQDFGLDLVIAGVLAWLLGWTYTHCGASLSNRRAFARNFVLLSMTTCLIITVVKANIALSLGLVGALSIVRFRSAIKEPEELAYLFLAIAIGLGLGANAREMTLLAFALILGMLWAKHQFTRKRENQNLFLTVSCAGDGRASLEQIVETLRGSCNGREPSPLRRERRHARGLLSGGLRRLLEADAGQGGSPEALPGDDHQLPGEQGPDLMELHRTRPRGTVAPPIRGTKLRVVLFAAYTLVVLLVGAWTYRSGLVTDGLFDIVDTIQHQTTRIGASLRADPVELRIDVKLKHWKTIAGKREDALRRNLLLTGSEDFVPAEILAENQVVPVKLRLKGDLRDHWADDDKWSLRVRTKGDFALFGMKQFSLQHPRTRGYLSEWVFHEALRREDLIALRYRFVKVHINGADKGIYALEEHFEKRLVEHNQRREGPIVRFNEDVSWAEAVRQGFLRFPAEKVRSGAGGYLAADVDAFQTSRWTEDESGHALYERALARLDGFRRGELKSSEAFDALRFARFLALTDVVGAAHASGWRNIRFYYNPVTEKLEPIGFDAGGHGALPIHSLVYTIPRMFAPNQDDVYLYDYAWFDALFADRDFYLAYVQELDRIGSFAYLDQLMNELRPELEANLDILHTEFPGAGFSDRTLRDNVAYIRSVLEPEHAVRSHLLEIDERRIKIAAGNLQFMPLELLGLELDGEVISRPTGGIQELAGRDPRRAATFETIRFELPGKMWESEELPRLRLRYRVVGTRSPRSAAVLPDPPFRLPDESGPRESTLADFNILSIDEARQQVTISRGTWTLTSDLILPDGYSLVVHFGTTLDLRNGAMILCRGPVALKGREDSPVIIRSSDNTGQGLCVIGAAGVSVLTHARFEGLDAPTRPGWELTGAVTFYESRVDANHCAFVGNVCEDALNVVRARFDITRCLFEDTFADAFDADFCNGSMSDTSFVSCGNDAFDVSGSQVELSRIFVRGAGDKGLSAGENSRVHAIDIDIEDALIGVAAKDLSQLTIEGARIANCRYAVAAYQKKPEFGPSTLTITGLEVHRPDKATGQRAIIEFGSLATLDGETVEGTETNVAAALYGAEQ